METITRNYTVFHYSELSDSAKQKVQEWYCKDLDSYWSEAFIEDATIIASLMGWAIDSVPWSGFWSQGDGACFVGNMRYAKGCSAAVKAYAPQDETLHSIATDWQTLQRKNFYSIRAVVKHRGHYSHEMCTEFDVEDTRHNYGWINNDDVETETKRIARAFMRWIYHRLSDAYDSETSAENVAGMCDANDWQFTADGRIFHA